MSDTPSIVFWRELLASYPDAKVILAVRDDAESWFKSQMSTIQPFAAELYSQTPSLWQRLRRSLLPVTAVDEMFMLLMKHHPQFQSGLYDLYHSLGTSKQMYDEWNADVIRTVPKERLLVLNLRSGWQPLCDFLDKPEPDHQFPRVNDGDTWRKHNAGLPRALNVAALFVLTKYLGTVAVVCWVVAYACRG